MSENVYMEASISSPDALPCLVFEARVQNIVARTHYQLVFAHTVVTQFSKTYWNHPDCHGWYSTVHRTVNDCEVLPTHRDGCTYAGT